MLLILARKATIVAIALLFRRNVNFLLSCLLMVLFLSYVMQVKHRPYMSTVERRIVIREHNLKAQEAEEANAGHENVRREAALHYELSSYLQGVLNSIEKKNRTKHKAMVRTISAARNKIEELSDQKRAHNYFFDYNTVEQVLLMCSIFMCLVAIMLQSEKFRVPVENSNGLFRPVTAEDDIFDFTFYQMVLVIGGIFLFGSIMYYFIVFLAEVLGYTPAWVMKCCSTKAKRSDFEDPYSKEEEIQLAQLENPLRTGQSTKLKKEASELQKKLQASEDANRQLVDHMKKLKKANVDYDVMQAKKPMTQKGSRRKKEMPQVQSRSRDSIGNI